MRVFRAAIASLLLVPASVAAQSAEEIHREERTRLAERKAFQGLKGGAAVLCSAPA